MQQLKLSAELICFSPAGGVAQRAGQKHPLRVSILRLAIRSADSRSMGLITIHAWSRLMVLKLSRCAHNK